MPEDTRESMVSFETVRQHYGIWRWKLERESSNRLVRLWTTVSRAAISPLTKFELMNVAWALASFERAYDILLEDAYRAERARRDGVPLIMHTLSGPYEQSLDYLLGMSLWMDLGEVLTSYRTIVDRFSHLRRSARRGRLSVPVTDINRELDILEARTLPALSSEPLEVLANRILHEAWHPGASQGLAFELYWKGDADSTVDFAEGDLRGELCTVAEQTLQQVDQFIVAVAPHVSAPATPSQPRSV